MEFQIACSCGQHMLVESGYVGQEVECPNCRGVLTVPPTPHPDDPIPVVTPERRVPVVEVGPIRTTPPPVPPSDAPAGGATPPAVGLSYGAPSLPVRTHGRAIAALVFAVLSFVLCPVVPALIALVLAGQAKREIRLRPDIFSGAGLATVAQIIAIFHLVVVGLIVVAFLLLPPGEIVVIH
jgi:hypothetical protein